MSELQSVWSFSDFDKALTDGKTPVVRADIQFGSNYTVSEDAVCRFCNGRLLVADGAVLTFHGTPIPGTDNDQIFGNADGSPLTPGKVVGRLGGMVRTPQMFGGAIRPVGYVDGDDETDNYDAILAAFAAKETGAPHVTKFKSGTYGVSKQLDYNITFQGVEFDLSPNAHIVAGKDFIPAYNPPLSANKHGIITSGTKVTTFGAWTQANTANQPDLSGGFPNFAGGESTHIWMEKADAGETPAIGSFHILVKAKLTSDENNRTRVLVSKWRTSGTIRVFKIEWIGATNLLRFTVGDATNTDFVEVAAPIGEDYLVDAKYNSAGSITLRVISDSGGDVSATNSSLTSTPDISSNTTLALGAAADSVGAFPYVTNPTRTWKGPIYACTIFSGNLTSTQVDDLLFFFDNQDAGINWRDSEPPFDIYSWADLAEWAGQKVRKICEFRSTFDYDSTVGPIQLPTAPFMVTRSRNPKAHIRFDYSQRLSDKLDFNGCVITRETVGDALLVSGCVPSYGAIPSTSRTLAIAQTYNDWGGNPFHAGGTGTAKLGTVKGMSYSAVWAPWFDDGREMTAAYDPLTNSDSEWFQCAIDACGIVATRIQGRVHYPGQEIVIGKPISLDNRYVELINIDSVQRDITNFNWTAGHRWQTPGAGAGLGYWPWCGIIVVGGSYLSGTSAGFSRKIRHCTVRGPSRATLEGFLLTGENLWDNAVKPTIFGFYDRWEEEGEVSNISIFTCAKHAFVFVNTNGGRVRDIHINDAGNTVDTAAKRRYRRSQSYLLYTGDENGGGQSVVDGIHINSDGGTAIEVRNNFHVRAHNIDYEGCDRLLYQWGNATHCIVGPAHGGNQQRETWGYTGTVSSITGTPLTVIKFSANHDFYNGEKVRLITSTVGSLPNLQTNNGATTVAILSAMTGLTGANWNEVSFRAVTSEENGALAADEIQLKWPFENVVVEFSGQLPANTTIGSTYRQSNQQSPLVQVRNTTNAGRYTKIVDVTHGSGYWKIYDETAHMCAHVATATKISRFLFDEFSADINGSGIAEYEAIVADVVSGGMTPGDNLIHSMSGAFLTADGTANTGAAVWSPITLTSAIAALAWNTTNADIINGGPPPWVTANAASFNGTGTTTKSFTSRLRTF